MSLRSEANDCHQSLLPSISFTKDGLLSCQVFFSKVVFIVRRWIEWNALETVEARMGGHLCVCSVCSRISHAEKQQCWTIQNSLFGGHLEAATRAAQLWKARPAVTQQVVALLRTSSSCRQLVEAASNAFSQLQLVVSHVWIWLETLESPRVSFGPNCLGLQRALLGLSQRPP